MEVHRREASERKIATRKRARLGGRTGAVAGALWLLALAGCSGGYSNGEKVWIAPGGLDATPGTWIVTKPWMVGTVLETKDEMVQVQVERGDSAGKEELRRTVQVRGTRWFPKRQLYGLKGGQAKPSMASWPPLGRLWTVAIRRFTLTGVQQVPKQGGRGGLGRVLGVVRRTDDGQLKKFLALPSILYIHSRLPMDKGRSMGLVISQKTREKLFQKHCVTEEEIVQCFASREGRFLIDVREEHRTDPPTHWFIAQTSYGRLLKVVFVPVGDDIHIKTAYEPNETEKRIYSIHGLGIS